MNDPTVAFMTAAKTALEGAGLTVVVNPSPSTALPYTVMIDNTVIEGELLTKTTEGTEITQTFTTWATSMLTALTDAGTIVTTLVNRATPLTITGHSVVVDALDFRGSVIKDDTEPNSIYYGVPVRVRYVLKQT